MNKSTLSVATFDGIPVTVPNTTEQKKGYYVSYNNYDTAIYGCDTTALVDDECNRFLILNGDHRDAYDKLSTYEECKEYFESLPEQHNKLSDNVHTTWADLGLPGRD